MSNNKELFKNFINDNEVFEKAMSYWEDTVNEIAKGHCIEEELLQKNTFDRDANPILYKHYKSINKSIRIIQEEFEEDSEHLGAWVQKHEEDENHSELVISVELTTDSKPVVETLIKAWFEDLSNDFDETLDNIIS
ncbi:MAG: hypothetical protein CL760_05590 [Chloroflexi bacterium]|nr:hypothetical protein [Chloroflexota bacterium]|tara:strand:- start:14129 stop:14536 length:408 start_codon:yes stop_codon:yes gene_type:complete